MGSRDTILKIVRSYIFPTKWTINNHPNDFNVHFLPRVIKGTDGCFPTV